MSVLHRIQSEKLGHNALSGRKKESGEKELDVVVTRFGMLCMGWPGDKRKERIPFFTTCMHILPRSPLPKKHRLKP